MILDVLIEGNTEALLAGDGGPSTRSATTPVLSERWSDALGAWR